MLQLCAGELQGVFNQKSIGESKGGSMIRLLVFIAIIALFTKPIFRLVYRCVRKLSAFWESGDNLEDKQQDKINAERSFAYELKQQEKEIKEKQKTLNNYKKREKNER